MLILSRHSGEAIRIGQDVRIVVLQIGGGKVRIGIEGPKHLRILREELYDMVIDLNQQAKGGDQLALDAWLHGTKAPE